MWHRGPCVCTVHSIRSCVKRLWCECDSRCSIFTKYGRQVICFVYCWLHVKNNLFLKPFFSWLISLYLEFMYFLIQYFIGISCLNNFRQFEPVHTILTEFTHNVDWILTTCKLQLFSFVNCDVRLYQFMLEISKGTALLFLALIVRKEMLQ